MNKKIITTLVFGLILSTVLTVSANEIINIEKPKRIYPPILPKNEYKIKVDELSSFDVSLDPESPDTPIITGPTEFKMHNRYEYTISTNDPQCDDVRFVIRTSDLPLIQRTDFCESGEIIIFSHYWDDFYQSSDPFIIYAKAIDCNGHESNWGSFEVKLKTKNSNNYIDDLLTNMIENLIEIFPSLEGILN